jgi:hypothetical protein
MKLFILLLGVMISVPTWARWPSMQAKWVERDYEKQIGILEYLDQGASSVIEERRTDAKEKMAEFCDSSKFKIMKEISGTKEFGGRAGPATTVAISNGSRNVLIQIGSEQKEVPIKMSYNYLAFRCVK